MKITMVRIEMTANSGINELNPIRMRERVERYKEKEKETEGEGAESGETENRRRE